MVTNTLPLLPQEILLQIIECLLPPQDELPVAYPQSHITTKTLLSLTRTSRKIYPLSTKLLYSTCLYIDTPRRLSSLLFTLTKPKTPNSRIPKLPMQSITSLYLSPFPEDTILNNPIANSISHLFQLIHPTLLHLIISIPLRSIYPDNDPQNIRPILRHAFTLLTTLETFASIQDELYLSITPGFHEPEIPIWTLWPNLRHLALYNVDVTPEFCTSLLTLRNLQSLILTRPDSLEEIDIKSIFLESTTDSPSRKLEIKVINTEEGFRGVTMTRNEDERQRGRVKIEVFLVPVSYYGDEDQSDLCQEWGLKRLLGRREWVGREGWGEPDLVFRDWWGNGGGGP